MNFLNLPQEIIERVLLYGGPQSYIRMKRSCQLANSILPETVPVLYADYKDLCERDYPPNDPDRPEQEQKALEKTWKYTSSKLRLYIVEITLEEFIYLVIHSCESEVERILATRPKFNYKQEDLSEVLYLGARRNNCKIIKEIVAQTQVSVDLVYPNSISLNTPLCVACALGSYETTDLLISYGANIKHINAEEFTPILIAAYGGNLDVCKLLIAKGANPFDRTENGAGVLHVNQYFDTELLDFFLSLGVDINDQDQRSMTPIFYAADTHNPKIIDYMISQGADPFQLDLNQGHLLISQASTNDTDWLEYLLSLGLDINHPDSTGWTAICFACQDGYIETCKYLIEKGAKTDISYPDGTIGNILEIAVTNNHLELCKYLVSIGIPFDDGQNTPLMMAIGSEHVEIVEYLLEVGVKVNITNEEGFVPLHLAVDLGLVEITKVLIKAGSNINQAGPEGNTPLDLAAKNGNLELCRLLVESGAEINPKRADGISPAMNAVSSINSEVYQYLVEAGSDPIPIDALNSLLLIFTTEGAIEAVKFIHSLGADIDSSTLLEKRCALWVSASLGHYECLEYFIENGAIIDNPDSEGITPLLSAVARGKMQIVEKLIEAGANINWVTKVKDNALGLAILAGDLNMAQFLFLKGVDPHFVNNLEQNAMIYACIAPIETTEICKWLLEIGIKFDAVDKTGTNGLYYAASKAKYQICSILLEKGVLAIPNNDGLTPLHGACLHSSVPLVELLLRKAEININAVSNNKFTALMFAVTNDHFEICKLLIENGADINVSQSDGITALWMAAMFGKYAICELLVNSSANLYNPPNIIQAVIKMGHLDIIKLLLKKGLKYKPNPEDLFMVIKGKGNRELYEFIESLGVEFPKALEASSYYGKLDIVKLCIERNFDVNRINTETQTTPIFVAAVNGHLDIVAYLASKGANINIVLQNHTPFSIAACQGHIDVCKLLVSLGADHKKVKIIGKVLNQDKLEIFKYLVTIGHDIEEFDSNGQSNLMLQIAGKKYENVIALLEAGADCDHQDYKGLSPLHIAAISGLEAVALLLQISDPNPHLKDENGFIPLHLCVAQNDIKSSSLLLACGSDPNQKDKNGVSSKLMAEKFGYTQLLSLLCDPDINILSKIVRLSDNRYKPEPEVYHQLPSPPPTLENFNTKPPLPIPEMIATRSLPSPGLEESQEFINTSVKDEVQLPVIKANPSKVNYFGCCAWF